MKLFSYVVARDYGFAPNPFYGYCTLAACKPQIRGGASIGDWIVGTGAKIKYRLAGHLVYAMKVDEALSFDQYWESQRFAAKKPRLNGSLKQVYGDNIYHHGDGVWIQDNSHHSLDDGTPNQHNIVHDTRKDRVLISRTFVYYGANAPPIPLHFRPYKPTGEDIVCAGQGHRVKSTQLALAFEKWLTTEGAWGLQGFPREFPNHRPISQSSKTNLRCR